MTLSLDDTKENANWYNSFVKSMQNMSQEIAKLRFEKYDRRRKEYYDKYKEDHDFQVGDMLFITKVNQDQTKEGK